MVFSCTVMDAAWINFFTLLYACGSTHMAELFCVKQRYRAWWPPSCCLDQPTPFLGSDEHRIGHLKPGVHQFCLPICLRPPFPRALALCNDSYFPSAHNPPSGPWNMLCTYIIGQKQVYFIERCPLSRVHAYFSEDFRYSRKRYLAFCFIAVCIIEVPWKLTWR